MTQAASVVSRPTWKEHPLVCYIRVLKPRETALLTLIGGCTILVASQGTPPWGRFLLALATILIGSGGANGLTNYLDRHIDIQMKRPRRRVLPAGLITPHQALAWSLLLVIAALALALALHPYAFVAGLVGVAAAVIGRKTWVTHFLGSVSSTGPILVGWFAMTPRVDATVMLLTLIILVWVPVHVWNLMIAYREDYLRAGVNIFPLDKSVRLTSQISLGLSSVMYAATLALWALGGFGWVYFLVANAVGPLMVYGCYRSLRENNAAASFKLLRISAYPFLGLTFLGLVADVWMRQLIG
jgi:protoheme IX farnesyltransferase